MEGSSRRPMAPAPRRSADRALLWDRPETSRPVKRAAVLTKEQIDAMLQRAKPRDRALIALLTAGAMRVGEATLLRWSVLEDCVLTVPGQITKTGRGRTITLPPAACAALLEWKEVCPATKDGWMFPGIAGKCLSVRAAQIAIGKIATSCGFDGVSSHSFRRSALTAAHQAGLSLRDVAEISGHQSLAALERYLDQDAAKEKAEAARGLLL
jgi:integrase/recombinase XerD